MIKIINIKKRNWLIRFLSTNHWKVTLKIDGKVKKLNCWAGIREPSESNLIFGIRQNLRGKIISIDKDKIILNLIGKEL